MGGRAGCSKPESGGKRARASGERGSKQPAGRESTHSPPDGSADRPPPPSLVPPVVAHGLLLLTWAWSPSIHECFQQPVCLRLVRQSRSAPGHGCCCCCWWARVEGADEVLLLEEEAAPFSRTGASGVLPSTTTPAINTSSSIERRQRAEGRPPQARLPADQGPNRHPQLLTACHYDGLTSRRTVGCAGACWSHAQPRVPSIEAVAQKSSRPSASSSRDLPLVVGRWHRLMKPGGFVTMAPWHDVVLHRSRRRPHIVSTQATGWQEWCGPAAPLEECSLRQPGGKPRTVGLPHMISIPTRAVIRPGHAGPSPRSRDLPAGTNAGHQR